MSATQSTRSISEEEELKESYQVDEQTTEQTTECCNVVGAELAKERDDEEQPEPALPTAPPLAQSIHSGTGPENPQEQLPDEHKQGDEKLPELPKIWDIHDPFLYAPPKPDRDPWSILLEPLLKKDKMQCDAWKEEVQNLLIFAGLFSAVVTAFIIESYKMLQRDPNDAIISLLSVIANRLDNTTIPAPILLSSIGSGSSFSPTTSSIRINNFWFISLVLSLATVLIGIISLQWIREHQNYPNIPPRESFALFNMRADGLKRWHVPKIFTALPLLLQSALILFLGGIVDFLSSFGDIAVTIPVTVVTVLVLLFLVATTILPALQSILLYSPYPYARTNNIPPPQCPYKSPQAHAFRATLSSVIQLWHKVRFHTGESLQSTYLFTKTNFSGFILITWTQKTWTEFDTAWVRLRDQFMQRSYNCLTNRDLYDFNRDFPVFDLTQAFMGFRNSSDLDLVENSLTAQYYCFAEVSTWITNHVISTPDEPPEAKVLVQTSQYLWNIMGFNNVDFFDSLSNFCDITRVEPSFGAAFRFSKLLHQENLVSFLQRLDASHGSHVDFSKVLRNHMLELATRLSGVLYKGKYGHRPAADLPSCLSIAFYAIENNTEILFWQWVNNFSTFFQGAVSIQPPYTPGGTLHTYQDTIRHVYTFAYVNLQTTFDPAEGQVRLATQGKFLATFQMITENLNEQMSSPDFREPNLLFYLTAVYLHTVNWVHQTYHTRLNGLLAAMQTYKARTIDAGIVNRDLEDIYGRKIDWTGLERFSPKWWDSLQDAFNRSRSQAPIGSRLSIGGPTTSPPTNA